MATLVTPRTLSGFRDYLPEVMLARERVLDIARGVYRSYGFTPIDTPACEALDVLLGKGGDESDKLVYRVRSARSEKEEMGLRFDLTVPFARFAAQYIPQLAADGRTVLGFHAVVSDITRQKLEERRLIELARVDPLTGLVNRSGFELRVAEAMDRCRSTGALMALMYLDIDRFKQINDVFGHNAGDTLLREFSSRLSQTLRSSDTVARLGGDEFTVIMEGLPRPEVASTVAAKIVQAMRAPFVIEHQTLHVTTSIGLAFYQGDATTVEALVKQADVMLYQAKGAGRNNFQVELRLVEGSRVGASIPE